MSHLHPGEGAAGTAPRRRSARLRSQIHASDEGARPARPRSARLRPQIDATEHGAGAASRRRSSRRSAQIHAIEEGAGVARHRSSRRSAQIHPIEEGAGVARHRSKRLCPQTRASEEPRPQTRRRTSPEPPGSFLDGEDMLREILVRLPLDLCSLPRASAVCKRWRGILVDPKFLRRFYAHHRKPPLLGVYEKCSLPEELVFTPTPTLATTPNRIPAELFSFGQRHSSSGSTVLDCRHGHGLVFVHDRAEFLVCDPISDKVRQVVVPEALFYSTLYQVRGAVLCAAGEQGHVHGACHSSPFKVVLMCYHFDDTQLLAGVYTSETDTWGRLISRELLPYFSCDHSTTLVGNVLYWSLIWGLSSNILRLDLDTQKLTMIDGPPGAYNYDKLQIIQAADGTVGVAILHYNNLQMWQRNFNSEGVAIWFRSKTVALRNILKIPPRTGSSIESLKFVGYDEDTDVIFLARQDGVYMVQTKSMQSRKLDGPPSPYYCYPFRSFYPPGTAIAGGTNGAEMIG